MQTFYIRVDLPDGERMPDNGEAFYVDNSHYEVYNGLTGHADDNARHAINILINIDRGLHPENYPPGHPWHDPSDDYWDDLPFEFRSRDEWVAQSNEVLLNASEVIDDLAWLDWPAHPDELSQLDRDKLIDQIIDVQDKELSEREAYQWDSGTIEWVSDRIQSFAKSIEREEA